MLMALMEGLKVAAQDVEKGGEFFICPVCMEPVILKKGRIKIAHFAHKASSDCSYGVGESDEHRRCKSEIFSELQALDYLTNVEMEKPLGPVRPDVYFESTKTGRRYAIEVQLSNLTVDKIISRTESYGKLGVYVLWLPQTSYRLYMGKYAPSAWEKWLHTLYFGTVYYWRTRLLVSPVHFDNFYISVPETAWGGGYEKRSKRYRTPKMDEPISIAESFTGIQRAAWHDGPIDVPHCRILTRQVG